MGYLAFYFQGYETQFGNFRDIWKKNNNGDIARKRYGIFVCLLIGIQDVDDTPPPIRKHHPFAPNTGPQYKPPPQPQIQFSPFEYTCAFLSLGSRACPVLSMRWIHAIVREFRKIHWLRGFECVCSACKVPNFILDFYLKKKWRISTNQIANSNYPGFASTNKLANVSSNCPEVDLVD